MSLFGRPEEAIVSIVQFFVLGWALLLLYNRTRGSQAEKILNGLLILLVFVFFFYVFHLRIFIKVFELLLPAILIGLVVLFAPEIRRFLHHLGRDGVSWIGLNNLSEKDHEEHGDHNSQSLREIAKEIVEAIKILSGNKVGALIVFEDTWSDRLFISSGRVLDAVISTELLLNIFYPKSPLHDGAVVILNRRIHAASVILPITENPKLNPWQYGTRHRAALGISETSQSVMCLVVSEETGAVSIAENGKINKLSDLKDLSEKIERKLRQGV